MQYQYKKNIKEFKGKKVEELNDLCIPSLLAWGYLEEIVTTPDLLEEIATTKATTKVTKIKP